MAAMSPMVTLLRNKTVRKMLETNMATIEIAREFGTSKQYVLAMIKRHKLDKPIPKKLTLPANEKKVLAIARKHKIELTVEDIQRF